MPTQYSFDLSKRGFSSNGGSGVEGFRVLMRQGFPIKPPHLDQAGAVPWEPQTDHLLLLKYITLKHLLPTQKSL